MPVIVTFCDRWLLEGFEVVDMQFPQLLEALPIKKDVHLTKNLSSRYDMVIGTDLMKELGIQLDFQND